MHAIDEAEWTWLRPHLQRDAVIVVSHGLHLRDVGRAIALDQKDQVEEWVAKGLMAKPTAAQIASWDERPAKRFLSMIVQPYVLVQERLDH